MKRLIIAVCMLITGIAISIGGYVNLKSICRNMSCSVNEVIRAAENGDADETKRKCDDTEKMWDKKSPLLGVYTTEVTGSAPADGMAAAVTQGKAFSQLKQTQYTTTDRKSVV